MKIFSFFLKKRASLIDALLVSTKFDKDFLLKALEYGSVHVKGRKTIKRRDPLYELREDEKILFYYDEKLLNLPPVKEVRLIYENNNFGIYVKEAGVLSQGTHYADHTSILRYVEKRKNKEVFLVHRLDRETPGLMAIAYTKKEASYLSSLFQNSKILKKYQAIAYDPIEKLKGSGLLDAPLDGKESLTEYEVLGRNGDLTLLDIKLHTGRLHQIRRHLDLNETPVLGDPKYGKKNKYQGGLQLVAYYLSFEASNGSKKFEFEINPMDYLKFPAE